MDEKRPILSKIIIEMMGSPKEHIEQVLKDYVEKLKRNEEYTVESTEFEEAKEQGAYFNAFAEIEMRFKTIEDLMGFCFDAMPASVELIEPEQITMNNRAISGLLNDLQGRLHQVEMIAKRLKSENTLINQNSLELLRNFVRYLIKEGNNTVAKIGELIGIKEEELKPFLQRMLEENQLNVEGEEYSIPK